MSDPIPLFHGRCIEGTGVLCHNGYRRRRVNGRRTFDHRHAWEAKYGPIPRGLVLDHLCRNRTCRNTDHLELVTNAVNVRRSRAAKLSMKQAKVIRRLVARGVVQRRVAERFGVSPATICHVVKGEKWK